MNDSDSDQASAERGLIVGDLVRYVDVFTNLLLAEYASRVDCGKPTCGQCLVLSADCTSK